MINGENFVGVATEHEFRKYQKKHNLLLACKEKDAQYIQLSDGLYRAKWLLPVTTSQFSYKEAEIIAIKKKEYEALLESIDKGDDIIIEPEPPVEEPEPPKDPNDEVTLEYIMASKINEMDNKRDKEVSVGVDVELSDKRTHHFLLSTKDRLDLLAAYVMAANKESDIPLRAKGESVKLYSGKDIDRIMSAVVNLRTYHMVYFDCLKSYILSLKDIDTISDVEYGMEIPSEFQTDAFKQVIKKKK